MNRRSINSQIWAAGFVSANPTGARIARHVPTLCRIRIPPNIRARDVGACPSAARHRARARPTVTRRWRRGGACRSVGPAVGQPSGVGFFSWSVSLIRTFLPPFCFRPAPAMRGCITATVIHIRRTHMRADRRVYMSGRRGPRLVPSASARWSSVRPLSLPLTSLSSHPPFFQASSPWTPRPLLAKSSASASAPPSSPTDGFHVRSSPSRSNRAARARP